jgi:hypothetical protein
MSSSAFFGQKSIGHAGKGEEEKGKASFLFPFSLILQEVY